MVYTCKRFMCIIRVWSCMTTSLTQGPSGPFLICPDNSRRVASIYMDKSLCHADAVESEPNSVINNNETLRPTDNSNIRSIACRVSSWSIFLFSFDAMTRTAIARCNDKRKATRIAERIQPFNKLIFDLVLASLLACKFFSSKISNCLLYTSPSPRDRTRSRMPSSA